jgi:hypothetical protein
MSVLVRELETFSTPSRPALRLRHSCHFRSAEVY